MFNTLPKTAEGVAQLNWDEIATYFEQLDSQTLTASNVDEWLADWSRVDRFIREVDQRLYVATTLNTADKQAEQRYHTHLQNVMQPFKAASQELKEKLLASGLEPDNFDIPLRNMRAQAELFRDVNLPLFTEERKLVSEYDRILGAQTVEWEGKETTLEQLRPLYQSPDRQLRETVWRKATSRQLQDRDAINHLWTQFMALRKQIADNADMADYRAYRWREMLRFDYTPEDCQRFRDAIEEVVVPAAQRIYEKRRQQFGYDSLRPWDLDADPQGRDPLRPFRQVDDLVGKTSAIFHKVDPQLGDNFDTMRRENLLDLENRKGKAPGGYCTEYALVQRPFIFMNSVGIHDDVQTLLHEGGHGFHVFEGAAQPYSQQQDPPIEFCEVASMSMELLGGPYLSGSPDSFYDASQAARARIDHLESIITFWPYMAVVDGFQHWVYTHHAEASNPANCDAKWSELWDRFMKGIDWSGLHEEKITGWHRKLHIHEVPFYYVEYGLAQLGAVQVWRNSLTDPAGAVANYRKALALGSTATLPQLFAAAGAKFQPDAATLRECVDLVETTLAQLENA
jgi:oligoendopeptidase F